jgi:hypothetical protein
VLRRINDRAIPNLAGGKTGYVYNVTLDGELVVERSRDPEHDLARVLLARGVTGKVTIHDGNTGKPRTIINFAKAAKLSAVERNRGRLALETYRETPRREGYSHEEPELVPTLPCDLSEAA